MKKVWKVLKTALILYVAGGIILYFAQDLFIFHPKALPRDHVFRFDQPFTELNIATESKRNVNIVQFHAQDSCKGIVLYFHGNRRNIERYAHFAPYFTKNNYDVWMIDYPGFGKSTGKRTEEAMCQDALLLYQMALKKTTPDKIIVYGKSLGTGVASYLASKEACQQLILETPYYSMTSLASHYFPIYPTSQLIRYSFPTHQYLKKVKVPITIFHGTKDEIIPYQHAVKLSKENPHAELVRINGGRHNNLYRFAEVTQKLDSLLQ